MNSNFSSKTCASADQKLETFIANLSVDTSHHRMEGQSVKCGFGLQGICCDSVPTGHVELLRTDQRVFAEPLPIPSWPETSCALFPRGLAVISILLKTLR